MRLKLSSAPLIKHYQNHILWNIFFRCCKQALLPSPNENCKSSGGTTIFFVEGHWGGKMRVWGGKNPNICQNGWFLPFFHFNWGGKWGQSLRRGDAPSCPPLMSPLCKSDNHIDGGTQGLHLSRSIILKHTEVHHTALHNTISTQMIQFTQLEIKHLQIKYLNCICWNDDRKSCCWHKYRNIPGS